MKLKKNRNYYTVVKNQPYKAFKAFYPSKVSDTVERFLQSKMGNMIELPIAIDTSKNQIVFFFIFSYALFLALVITSTIHTFVFLSFPFEIYRDRKNALLMILTLE